MNTNIELLPCPFCGGEAEASLVHDGWCCECKTFFMQSAFDMTEPKSIRRWNRRAPQPDAAAIRNAVLLEVETAIADSNLDQRYMFYHLVRSLGAAPKPTKDK